jgi:hypothetical protein
MPCYESDLKVDDVTFVTDEALANAVTRTFVTDEALANAVTRTARLRGDMMQISGATARRSAAGAHNLLFMQCNRLFKRVELPNAPQRGSPWNLSRMQAEVRRRPLAPTREACLVQGVTCMACWQLWHLQQGSSARLPLLLALLGTSLWLNGDATAAAAAAAAERRHSAEQRLAVGNGSGSLAHCQQDRGDDSGQQQHQQDQGSLASGGVLIPVAMACMLLHQSQPSPHTQASICRQRWWTRFLRVRE